MDLEVVILEQEAGVQHPLISLYQAPLPWRSWLRKLIQQCLWSRPLGTVVQELDKMSVECLKQ
jgi:hypothetical protein